MSILTINLVMSTIVFAIAARLYVMPRLRGAGAEAVIIPILLLHSLRHLGLMFLAPGATYVGLPQQFAVPAAFGDFATSILALIALSGIVRKSRVAVPALAVFNIVGSIDLIAAITLATITSADPYMGAAYWIPAFWVPALLVTHFVVFIHLWRQLQSKEKNHG